MGVQITQGIVGQSRKMQDCVEALEIRLRNVAEILANLRNIGGNISEIAPCKKIRVEPYHFVTSGTKHRFGNGADVSFVTCEKNSHSISHRNRNDSRD